MTAHLPRAQLTRRRGLIDLRGAQVEALEKAYVAGRVTAVAPRLARVSGPANPDPPPAERVSAKTLRSLLLHGLMTIRKDGQPRPLGRGDEVSAGTVGYLTDAGRQQILLRMKETA